MRFFAKIVTAEYERNTDGTRRRPTSCHIRYYRPFHRRLHHARRKSSISYIFLRAKRMSGAYYYRERHETDRESKAARNRRDVSAGFPIHESRGRDSISFARSRRTAD